MEIISIFVKKMESQKIKQLLAENSISQKEFAETIGVHPITLNKCLKENKFTKKNAK